MKNNAGTNTNTNDNNQRDTRTTDEIIKAWMENRARIPEEMNGLSRYQLQEVLIDFAYRLEAADRYAHYHITKYKQKEANANRRQDYDAAKEASINALRFQEIQHEIRTPIITQLYGVTERQFNKRHPQRVTI